MIRLSGESRFDTAAAVALDRFDPADADVVYLATGRNFSDAVAAGPATAGAPILLTPGDALADDTATWLTANTPDRIVVIGGTNAIPDEVLAQLETLLD